MLIMRYCRQGVEVKDSQISIFADVIEEQLGVSCSALSGANIADEGTVRELVDGLQLAHPGLVQSPMRASARLR